MLSLSVLSASPLASHVSFTAVSAVLLRGVTDNCSCQVANVTTARELQRALCTLDAGAMDNGEDREVQASIAVQDPSGSFSVTGPCVLTAGLQWELTLGGLSNGQCTGTYTQITTYICWARQTAEHWPDSDLFLP
nr:uncharacterized protein LOC129382686 [Dermacentor andersoni]